MKTEIFPIKQNQIKNLKNEFQIRMKKILNGEMKKRGGRINQMAQLINESI